jgi:uncharacterized protein involved in outer membrane biogenesis
MPPNVGSCLGIFPAVRRTDMLLITMEKPLRRRLVVTAAASLAAMALAMTLLILLLDAGYGREAVVQFVSHRTARNIRIEGPLRWHLLSTHPSVVAESVVIGNPAWTKPGVTAEIQKITLGWGTPFTRSWGLEVLLAESVRLHLISDELGRANWQREDPARDPGGDFPMLRRVSIRDAHVELNDTRRHLQFQGSISLYSDPPPGADTLHLVGGGQLNDHEVKLELTGEPLATVASDKTYRFSFDERSSGSHLQLQGSLPKPFDIKLLDGEFQAQGADLRDLHYLVGLGLINTGPYRLSGRLARRGAQTAFTHLAVHSGESDLSGSVASEIQKDGRSIIDANLQSQLLRFADLGLQAAGRDPDAATATPKMFSDAAVNTDVMRRVDADVQYHAARVAMRKLELQSVAGRLSLKKGMVSLPALTGGLLGGKWHASVRMNANLDNPESHLDLQFADVQLALLPHKSEPPPLDGALKGSVVIDGRGRSLHQLAATADGMVTAGLSAGLIRDSLAELAGTELRGLGLVIAHSKREAAVRCAALQFAAKSGTLIARTLIVDAEPVLIRGEGTIALDSESLDLTLHGEPRTPRILRLASPIKLTGTLSEPHAHLEAHAAGLKVFDRGASSDGTCR